MAIRKSHKAKLYTIPPPRCTKPTSVKLSMANKTLHTKVSLTNFKEFSPDETPSWVMNVIINKMLPLLKECEFLKNAIENNNLNRTKINNSLKEISNTIYYSVKFSNICGKKLREEELRKSQIEIKKSITGGELKHNKYVLQDNSAINKLQNFEEKIISEIVRVNKI